jgi:primosomal protein N' (replication factor Y)
LKRAVRVLPDLTAVDRAFDYCTDLDVPVGTIVRVPLQGRRVRGWIVEDDVVPETSELLDVLGAVSAGPPSDVVDLSTWVAHRWVGPRVAVLRSASPPNNVASPSHASLRHRDGGRSDAWSERVVRWPPLLDRRELVASMCAPDGSTIVCVADAGRSRALARYLQEQGRNVALLHSFESDAQRTAAWAAAARGACIVVGGRIAALAPVPDLAAAVVVDDADEALQEERAPTWHARDVLRERAARARVPFVVCAPAPTPEAVFAVEGKVETPAADVEHAGWPRVQVVDRREEPPGAGLLSGALADAFHRTNDLSVCVLNRRGGFRLLACASCHHVVRVDPGEERPLVCPECGATKLRVIRSGVNRMREELEALLPHKRVTEVDAATDNVAADVEVVVGTEAVLHRAEIRRRRVGLVAYLDLDQELLAPRYRAAMQAHWLITRGAQLLAGRPRADSLLLLQTRIPDHVVVRAIERADPGIVVDSELEYRRALGYPPFGALAELSGNDDALAASVDALQRLETQATGVAVFGPNDGRALVTGADWSTMADALSDALPVGRAIGRVRAAVDPPRV